MARTKSTPKVASVRKSAARLARKLKKVSAPPQEKGFWLVLTDSLKAFSRLDK